MKTYTKSDDGSALVTTDTNILVQRYDLQFLLDQRDRLTAEIDFINALIIEAEKLGVILSPNKPV